MDTHTTEENSSEKKFFLSQGKANHSNKSACARINSKLEYPVNVTHYLPAEKSRMPYKCRDQM